mgnify:CR=1 FL=1
MTATTKKQAQANKRLLLDEIELNEGQLNGLPSNPRFIRDEKFKALVKSIRESPELLKARPLLVYQMKNGKYVTIAGNMRLRACREIGMKDVPCYIFPKSTSVKKLREYTLKDNMAYGQIDWENIANEWEPEELKEWDFEMPEDWMNEQPEPLTGEEEEPPEELTADEKQKPFTIKIVCEDEKQLQAFANDIQQLINDKYTTANYSVSGGEL